MENRCVVEELAQEAYRSQFAGGERRVTMNREDGIRPSTIPDQIPTRSDEEIQKMCRVVTPQEEIPPWRRVGATHQEVSDEEEEEREEKRSWKRTRMDEKRERENQVPQQPLMLPSDMDEREEEDVPTTVRYMSPCPVVGCTWKGRRVRSHVNLLHLPRVMWDSHHPPVKPTKLQSLDDIRLKILKYLARQILGSSNLEALKKWCSEKVYVPATHGFLGRHIEQMRRLTYHQGWAMPELNRYTLTPLNHISCLIYWRFQAGMVNHLSTDARMMYFSMGMTFMMDPGNFIPPLSKKMEGDSMLSRNILTPVATKEDQPIWDEGCELDNRVVVLSEVGRTDKMSAKAEAQKVEEDQRVVVLDNVGETDDGEFQFPEEMDQEIIKEEVRIGDRVYTLVLRGSSLDIGGEFRLRLTTDITPVLDDRWGPYDVFDSHFHLDRSSKKLLGNLGLDVDVWLSEQMERPPNTVINVVGGVMIFCDPEKYPKNMPIDDKWKVAIGIHPKKVKNTTADQKDQFVKLIRSRRVAAVGEIGLDRTEGIVIDEQREFLVTMAPYIAEVKKPVIFHLRSHRSDEDSKLAYLVLLKICVENFPDNQTIVLHCFTGSIEIVKAWLQHFPDTYFGITHLASTFSKSQKKALKEIPPNRLLLETDSPYISPRGISINSPIYIGETAAIVARVRETTLEIICRTTTVNAATVFDL